MFRARKKPFLRQNLSKSSSPLLDEQKIQPLSSDLSLKSNDLVNGAWRFATVKANLGIAFTQQAQDTETIVKSHGLHPKLGRRNTVPTGFLYSEWTTDSRPKTMIFSALIPSFR
jgi:hypothetical protein